MDIQSLLYNFCQSLDWSRFETNIFLMEMPKKGLHVLDIIQKILRWHNQKMLFGMLVFLSEEIREEPLLCIL